MWSPSEATNLRPSGPAMTGFEAAAEAWYIGDSFAGDAYSDDGNSLDPSDGPCPTDVVRTTAPCPVAWEAQERALKHTFAMILPVAMAALLPGCGPVSGTRLGPWAGPPPSAMALAEASPLTFLPSSSIRAPGPAAPDVASRYHRRDPLQGPNDFNDQRPGTRGASARRRPRPQPRSRWHHPEDVDLDRPIRGHRELYRRPSPSSPMCPAPAADDGGDRGVPSRPGRTLHGPLECPRRARALVAGIPSRRPRSRRPRFPLPQGLSRQGRRLLPGFLPGSSSTHLPFPIHVLRRRAIMSGTGNFRLTDAITRLMQYQVGREESGRPARFDPRRPGPPGAGLGVARESRRPGGRGVDPGPDGEHRAGQPAGGAAGPVRPAVPITRTR